MKDLSSLLAADLVRLGFCGNADISVHRLALINRAMVSFTNTVSYDGIYTLESVLFFKFSFPSQRYTPTSIRAKIYEDAASDSFLSHTYELAHGPLFTQKEIFNLFQGRCVYRVDPNAAFPLKGQWYYLQSKPANERKRYTLQVIAKTLDLERLLPIYPISGIEDNVYKSCLIISLQKGNLHSVIFHKQEKTERMYIDAEPRFQRINIYSPTALTNKRVVLI